MTEVGQQLPEGGAGDDLGVGHQMTPEPVTSESVKESVKESGKEKPPAKTKKKFNVVEFLKSHNVSDLVIESFLSHRKKKNADNSPIALNAFVREAGKAGISLEQALIITIERNWQGFNSSWKWRDDAITIGGNNTGRPLSKQEQVEAHNQRLVDQMFGGNNAQ